MKLPLYSPLHSEGAPTPAGHTGLWFERFFYGYDTDWSVPDGAKAGWLDKIPSQCGDTAALKAMQKRRVELAESLGGGYRAFRLEGRLVTGMGYPHPVENGFAWHPTLGVPYLTGAAVKGLLRAFCEAWDETDPERIERWFGVGSGEQGRAESAGALQFFEAIPVDAPRLRVDIMTPHMGKWYEAGDQVNDPWKRDDADKVPGDWHDPTPIPFLTAENATFLFAVAPRRPSQAVEGEVNEALGKLAEALEWIGAGAKTAVGYGFMARSERAEQEWEHQRAQAREEEEKARKEAELAAATEGLSPEEKEMANLSWLLQEKIDTNDKSKGGPATDKASELRRRAFDEEWAPEHKQQLADLVEKLYGHVGYPKQKAKKEQIKKDITRLRGEQ